MGALRRLAVHGWKYYPSLTGMPLTGLKRPEGERTRIMNTGRSQARRDGQARDPVARWIRFSLSEIVFRKKGGKLRNEWIIFGREEYSSVVVCCVAGRGCGTPWVVLYIGWLLAAPSFLRTSS